LAGWDRAGEAYGILVRILLWKRALIRPRSRWKGNIKINLQELGCEDGRWMELVQDHVHWRVLVSDVLNLGALCQLLCLTICVCS
jgi:hypothetical protein